MLHDGVVPRESVSAEGVVVVRRNGEDREGHDWGVSGTRRGARRTPRGRRGRRAQLGRFQRSTADNLLLAFSTAPTFDCPKTRVLQHSTVSTSDCSYTRHLSPKSQSVQTPCLSTQPLVVPQLCTSTAALPPPLSASRHYSNHPFPLKRSRFPTVNPGSTSRHSGFRPADSPTRQLARNSLLELIESSLVTSAPYLISIGPTYRPSRTPVVGRSKPVGLGLGLTLPLQLVQETGLVLCRSGFAELDDDYGWVSSSRSVSKPAQAPAKTKTKA